MPTIITQDVTNTMRPRFTLKIGHHLQSAPQKRFYNEQVFSEIAPRYDFITQALSFQRDAAWKRQLIDWLPTLQTPCCADIACGTGDLAFLLETKYPRGSIVGLDITKPMLDIAHARNTHHRIRFSRADMTCLPFASNSVDIITGGYALRNAPNLETTLDEVHRVLKTGGTAGFLEFSKSDSPFAQKLEYILLKLWTGLWGILLHRNAEVYGYIAESLKTFPDRTALRQLLRKKGFTVIRSRLNFFGITELLIVRKTTHPD